MNIKKERRQNDVKVLILFKLISLSVTFQCEICLDLIKELPGAHPVGCLDIFHEDCLREWQKVI